MMNENKYLEKAIRYFTTEGLSMSMEEIAQGIGVTKKTLYNHFSNKDELIGSCLGIVTEKFCRSVDCMNDPGKDVRVCFKDGIEALRSFFREMSPVFLNDMLKYYPALISDDHQQGSRYFINLLEENIRRGQTEKIYRAEIDPELIADYISFSIIAYFRKSVMLGNRYSAEHYFTQIVEFCLNALT